MAAAVASTAAAAAAAAAAASTAIASTAAAATSTAPYHHIRPSRCYDSPRTGNIIDGEDNM